VARGEGLELGGQALALFARALDDAGLVTGGVAAGAFGFLRGAVGHERPLRSSRRPGAPRAGLKNRSGWGAGGARTFFLPTAPAPLECTPLLGQRGRAQPLMDDSMYAVIKTGGKQYRVSEGDRLRVEKLAGEVGGTVELDEVLMLGGDAPKIGKPTVAGAKVVAEIVAQDRAKKIIVFKIKRRKNYRRKNGHRQPYTELRIKAIQA